MREVKGVRDFKLTSPINIWWCVGHLSGVRCERCSTCKFSTTRTYCLSWYWALFIFYATCQATGVHGDLEINEIHKLFMLQNQVPVSKLCQNWSRIRARYRGLTNEVKIWWTKYNSSLVRFCDLRMCICCLHSSWCLIRHADSHSNLGLGSVKIPNYCSVLSCVGLNKSKISIKRNFKIKSWSRFTLKCKKTKTWKH